MTPHLSRLSTTAVAPNPDAQSADSDLDRLILALLLAIVAIIAVPCAIIEYLF